MFTRKFRNANGSVVDEEVRWGLAVGLAAATIVLLVFGLFGCAAGKKSYDRYQRRADANNQVKVTAIQIRNQEQRVKIAQQRAEIRVREAEGIRRAQDKIQATLTPLYVQFEMVHTLQEIARSGQNNSVVFVPTNGSGVPVIPGLTEKAGR